MEVRQRLNKKQLAHEMNMGTTTLWRCLNESQRIAKKYKLPKLPSHSWYPGGRKYFYLDEIKDWLEVVKTTSITREN